MVAKAGDDRKVEDVEEQYHFRGIQEQVITSFIRLQVPGALGGQVVHHAPSITDDRTTPLAGNDQLFPWSSTVHLHLGDCWLDIPSRGIKATLMVTTSNHVLVDMADTVDDLEIEGEMCLAANRSHSGRRHIRL